MAQQKFKSKIDAWLGLLLIAVVVLDMGIIVRIALQPGDPASATFAILACIGASALMLSLLLCTYYAVDKHTLRIVSGPFRWTIAIDEIRSVSPTHSLWSSPALSLDRLLIRYGKGRKILVSPADKNEFLRAIGHDGE